MPQSACIKTTIRNFLIQHIRNIELTDTDDIFQQGLVNSLFAMQLVNFVEKQFDLIIENDELDIKNFSSINNIESFITNKK